MGNDYDSSAYLQVLKNTNLKWPRKPEETIFSDPQEQLTP